MNDKEVVAEVTDRCRLQSSLLSKFEEIAQTFLKTATGERGNGKVFSSLQEYLDGSVVVDGAYCRRRTVVLAIHDMNDEQEAPAILQRSMRAELELLDIKPVPKVRFYSDVATAILRMEVVIRLEAMQRLAQAKSAGAGRLSPALGQTSSFGTAQKAPRRIPN